VGVARLVDDQGTVGVVAGLIAGSIALVGFGLDSAIEGLASVIVVWRFTGSRMLSATSERRAQQLVAVSFFLLAPYVALESLRTLIGEHHAETSIVGIALTVGTLAICPGAWYRQAEDRGSARVARDQG
jgi:divalent metal cation (Fe/Co/Zn/Cd) transporter